MNDGDTQSIYPKIVRQVALGVTQGAESDPEKLGAHIRFSEVAVILATFFEQSFKLFNLFAFFVDVASVIYGANAGSRCGRGCFVVSISIVVFIFERKLDVGIDNGAFIQ